MSYTCHTRVIHMSYTCHTHVSYMSSHVIHMSYICPTHVIHMSYTCHTRVLHMSHTCHTHVFNMSYTCHTHDQCARFPIQKGMTGAAAAATPHRSGPRPQRTYQTPGRGRMARFAAMSSRQWRSATAQPGNLSAWPRGWPKVRPGTTPVALHLSSTNETL